MMDYGIPLDLIGSGSRRTAAEMLVGLPLRLTGPYRYRREGQAEPCIGSLPRYARDIRIGNQTRGLIIQTLGWCAIQS